MATAFAAAVQTDPTAVAGSAEAGADPFVAELCEGVERLRRMSPEELRALIARRVALLDTTLREREARRATIEEAQMAAKILAFRRARAQTISRRVNLASGFAAIASTLLIVAVMA
ncbi:MAG: hypothetical protein FJX67_11050 [Alphaproteobacteria bacterium]|nr:hypothetical protein [Alphaproteobacteria bacterium]